MEVFKKERKEYVRGIGQLTYMIGCMISDGCVHIQVILSKDPFGVSIDIM